MQEGACSNLLSKPSEFKPQKHIQSLMQETSWGCLLGGGRFGHDPSCPCHDDLDCAHGCLLKEFLWLNCPKFVDFFWDTSLKLRQCPLFILGHGLEIQCPWLWGVLAKTRCGFLWIRVHILASFPFLFFMFVPLSIALLYLRTVSYISLGKL